MIHLDALEQSFDDALLVALPNPVALIFSDLELGYQGKRDLVFGLGLLNEGENEFALIAGFIRDRTAASPGADVAHLEREAWYYLRTSTDATWQFDAGEPAIEAGLAYLLIVLRERSAAAAAARQPPLAETEDATERNALLRRMRSAAGISPAPL